MDMDLFARVRERLLDGTLWPLTNDHVIGGPGTNEPCAVCDHAITSGAAEYEVAGPVMIVHVHVACYHAWSGESQRSAGLLEENPVGAVERAAPPLRTNASLSVR